MLAAVLMMSTSCFNQYDVQSDGGTGIECMRDGYKTVDLVGCRGYVRTLGPPVDECRCTCDCSGGGIDYEDQNCVVTVDTSSSALWISQKPRN